MKQKIKVLFSNADREAMQPLLDALRARGLDPSEAKGVPGKDETVLAALSEAFYADKEKTDALFGLIGAGAENVLPVQLDAAPIPDAVKNALYARNIIPAAGRDFSQIAERVAAALPKKKSRLPVILSAAALVLIAVVGLIIWRNSQTPPEEPVPAMAEEPAITLNLPGGLTEADLATIEAVFIAGDRAEFITSADLANKWHALPNTDEFVNREYDRNGAHYYSKEDGRELTMTRYDDLSFLSLMPKLKALYLCNVEVGVMPELKEIPRMQQLFLGDCEISDLDWVTDATILQADILNTTGSIRDFSPLSSCNRLGRLHIDLTDTRQADLAGLSPRNLNWLWINGGSDLDRAPDLSGLAECKALAECELQGLPLEDLDFLKGIPALRRLRLVDLNRLRDISALSSLNALTSLDLDDCYSLRDYSVVGQCRNLEDVMIYAGWDVSLRDASFLGALPRLRSIELYSVDLPDLDFLREIGARRSTLNSFEFSGEVDDYSGLAAIEKYDRLSLDSYDGSIEKILPHLQGVSVADLMISRANRVDLSALPRPTSRLLLDRCGLTDLSTMPADWTAGRIILNNCSGLRSLEGLQNQTRFGVNHNGYLEIYNCPRLADWSALNGMSLASLKIMGGFTLPAFENFETGELRLDRVAEVSDLSFLDGMNTDYPCSFALVGLDDLTNLMPLSRFHGSYLAVPPQLEEQARDLVIDGNFREYRVEYPEGGWELEDVHLSLLSLDELETMPKAMLRHVDSLCIVGDTLVDTENTDVWQDWGRGNTPTMVLHDRATGQETPVKKGSGVITDLSILSELTGLRHLELFDQPLKSLDGIQNFTQLEYVRIAFCSGVRDASPVFALPGLWGVSLQGCPVDSIQGVQNLYNLNQLDINETRVSDLSPLAECDFSRLEEEGRGLDLHIGNLPIKDYSPLASIPAFENLDINNAPAAAYLPYLENASLRRFAACDSFMRRGETKDPNEAFARLIAEHPELRELWIPWNQDLTDLTPILSLEGLEYVRVSHDMKKAIESIEGAGYSFDLEIEK